MDLTGILEPAHFVMELDAVTFSPHMDKRTGNLCLDIVLSPNALR